MVQVPLDLNFEKGDQVSFATNGKSHVHLTGYIHEDPLDDFEEEEDDEEQDVTAEEGRKRKMRAANGEARKKIKTELMANEEEDEDSDSDVDLDALMDSNIEEEEGQDDEETNEESEEENDEDNPAEEEEDEEGDSSEDEEQPVKQNGLTPKSKKNKQQQQPEKKTEKQKQEKKQAKKTVEGGVVIEDLKMGIGAVAKPGKNVQVYYEGRLKQNNKVFDSSKKGQGFKFRLGKQEVIKGWDVGLQGMKVGGKRRIVCPPNMGYGAKGSPPVIPPNSTLIFDVELKSVN